MAMPPPLLHTAARPMSSSAVPAPTVGIDDDAASGSDSGSDSMSGSDSGSDDEGGGGIGVTEAQFRAFVLSKAYDIISEVPPPIPHAAHRAPGAASS